LLIQINFSDRKPFEVDEKISSVSAKKNNLML